MDLFSRILVVMVPLLLVHATADGLSPPLTRFVRFRSIEYTAHRVTYGRDPTPDDLGPEFGRVTCDILGMYLSAAQSTASSEESSERKKRCAEQEGAAAAIPIGTAFYTMRAYRPEYRLVARLG